MFIRIKYKPILFFITALLCLVLFSGCAGRMSEEQLYSVEVTPEKLHQVEPMVLKEAESQDDELEIIKDKTEPSPLEIKLSLEECRALTIENNLDLKVQLINPTVAAERITEAEAGFEAVFNARSVYSKSDSPTATSLEGSKEDTAYTTMGVSMPLKTGGNISLDFLDYKYKSNNPYQFLNPSNTSQVSASISQPLLRNAGKRVSTYSIGLAEYNSQIVSSQTKLEAIRIIANADRAYWNLYAARKLLDVRKQQYDLAKNLFEQTERLVEVGIKPEIELLRTKSALSSRVEGVITAENSVKKSERVLKQTLNKAGMDTDSITAVIPSTEPDPVKYDIDRHKMIAAAIENRMDMLELELRLAQESSTVDYRRNKTLPLVTMEYHYNINGLGSDRGDSYDMLSKYDYNDHYFELNMSIPIGNKAAKSRLSQAVYERNRRLASKESKRAQIKMEVLNQIDQLEATWQNIMASRQTTILRDQQYKAEKRQYELGMLTSTDVLEAQTDLADAQRMEIVALTQYQIALVDLAYATGTLLGAAKVELGKNQAQGAWRKAQGERP